MMMRLFKPIVGLILLTLALSGCYLQSLNPFYFQEDLITDDEIVGQWTGNQEKAEQGDGWVFEKTEASYVLTITENGVSTPMVVNLFELQGEKFMDFYPDVHSLKGYAGIQWAPVHLLAKYTIGDDGLVLYPLNLEWFKNMALKRKIDIDYTVYGDNQALLTADTETIQRFLSQYLDQAFSDGMKIELKRFGAETTIGSEDEEDQETQDDDEEVSQEELKE